MASGEASAELREKGSRFVAAVAAAADETAAAAFVERRRAAAPDATHHCWAWRLGAEGSERCSDAGEPAGTAGQPMLRVLRGAGISDVAVVVTRWFGGTKLGKGGLARAYAGVVKAALGELAVAERHTVVELAVELPYDRLGALKRLVRPPLLRIASEEYGDAVRLRLAVHAERLEETEEALAALGAKSERER